MGREYVRLIDGRVRPALDIAARVLTVALVGALTFATSQRSYPLLRHQERQGLWQGLTTFAQQLPQDAVLLFDDSNVSRILTPPMELLFGHPSFLLQDTEALQSEAPVTDRLITQALAQQRPVYLVITGGMQTGLLSGWQLVGRGATSLDTTTLGLSWGRLPWAGDIEHQSLFLDTYSVLPRAENGEGAAPTATLDIPLGPGSYPYMADGFYPWTLDETGIAVRWTKDVATIRTPWPVGEDAPLTGCLRLDLSNWRDNGEPLHLVVQVEEQRVYAGTLAGPMGRQTLDLPLSEVANAGSTDLEIRLYSSTFVPQNPDDPRELGALLYGVQLLPADQCSQP